MEVSDGVIDFDAFLAWLNSEIKRDGTQKATAGKFGLSPQFLNDILQGHRKPGEMTLSMMGWQRVVRVTYERVEEAHQTYSMVTDSGKPYSATLSSDCSEETRQALNTMVDLAYEAVSDGRL